MIIISEKSGITKKNLVKKITYSEQKTLQLKYKLKLYFFYWYFFY